ncbi:MAG: AAA family ATPase [Oscillospiraceae bacterium]|nr:AAA family ATPase [Oscillospiraceae bacterium]
MEQNMLRPVAEMRYAAELEALAKWDIGNPKPQGWRLSPKAVRTFILGSAAPIGGVTIGKKYMGNDALVERCIITLAGNRGLMLVGEPGTAKTMLSELLSAAISGCSTNTVQGTAGTTEDMIKYSWNYAMLLAKGPSREALVPSPLYVGMEKGILTRFEEITRTPAEVQDSLISVLSDKVLNIPELGDGGLLFAKPGFNVIGTANTQDKGVNEMSSALKRRFNFETVQPIRDVALEKKIILNEVGALAEAAGIGRKLDEEAAELLATTYHELREGVSAEGMRIEKPACVMSTAEAISVYYQTLMGAYYYGDGTMDPRMMVENLVGAVAKESNEDMDKIGNYFSTVVREKARREGGVWQKYYAARSCLK